MARPKIPTINWRSELAQLDRFIRKEGGVVHIRTTSESPSSAFAKALRSRMEHGTWEVPWQTIQIDSNNSATHYLIDIIGQFEITLGIDSICTKNTNTAVTIGSNIVAGGDVNINDIHVNISHTRAALHARAERICSTISNFSEKQRLGIFVVNADKDESNESARNAIEDLKNFFVLSKMHATENEANAAARAIVSGNPKPKELLATLAATLSNMEKWR